jgi:hypothetical protein
MVFDTTLNRTSSPLAPVVDNKVQSRKIILNQNQIEFQRQRDKSHQTSNNDKV